jgi:hypothetical protein
VPKDPGFGARRVNRKRQNIRFAVNPAKLPIQVSDSRVGDEGNRHVTSRAHGRHRRQP